MAFNAIFNNISVILWWNLNLGIVYIRVAFLIVHGMFDDEFNMEIEIPRITFVLDD